MISTVNPHALTARATSPSIDRSRATIGNFARLAERLWMSYWDRQARRATMLLLESLDDRTLSDMGFQRSEIQSAVFGPPDRMRPYHADWMWARPGSAH
jgi:uncharacterized protein YjiS (DUF1127 family)